MTIFPIACQYNVHTSTPYTPYINLAYEMLRREGWEIGGHVMSKRTSGGVQPLTEAILHIQPSS